MTLIENQLLDFYKSKLTSWNLIYKPIAVQYRISKSIFTIITLFFIAFYLYSLFSGNNNTTLTAPVTYLIIYCLIVIILFQLFKKIVIYPAQEQALKKYKINVKSPYWNESISLIIKSFLIQNNILNGDPKTDEKTLDFLIDIFHKRIEHLEKKDGLLSFQPMVDYLCYLSFLLGQHSINGLIILLIKYLMTFLKQ